jgi:2-haloacid dehalogenase
MPEPRIILFDVNETLLDLSALDPHFRRAFGRAAVRQQWFAQVLQSALVATVIGAYADFGTIAADALDMTAERLVMPLSASDRAQILDGMLTLPPHAEVDQGLARLRDAGLRLATLTNSTARAAQAQLASAGLTHYFEQTLSVEAVRRFKPAAETYRMAAARLGVEVERLRLVAAHDWDVAGALRAGCAAAFVARPGMLLGPLAKRPDVIGQDLTKVVDGILHAEGLS